MGGVEPGSGARVRAPRRTAAARAGHLRGVRLVERRGAPAASLARASRPPPSTAWPRTRCAASRTPTPSRRGSSWRGRGRSSSTARASAPSAWSPRPSARCRRASPSPSAPARGSATSCTSRMRPGALAALLDSPVTGAVNIASGWGCGWTRWSSASRGCSGAPSWSVAGRCRTAPASRRAGGRRHPPARGGRLPPALGAGRRARGDRAVVGGAGGRSGGNRVMVGGLVRRRLKTSGVEAGRANVRWPATRVAAQTLRRS